MRNITNWLNKQQQGWRREAVGCMCRSSPTHTVIPAHKSQRNRELLLGEELHIGLRSPEPSHQTLTSPSFCQPLLHVLPSLAPASSLAKRTWPTRAAPGSNSASNISWFEPFRHLDNQYCCWQWVIIIYQRGLMDLQPPSCTRPQEGGGGHVDEHICTSPTSSLHLFPHRHLTLSRSRTGFKIAIYLVLLKVTVCYLSLK